MNLNTRKEELEAELKEVNAKLSLRSFEKKVKTGDAIVCSTCKRKVEKKGVIRSEWEQIKKTNTCWICRRESNLRKVNADMEEILIGAEVTEFHIDKVDTYESDVADEYLLDFLYLKGKNGRTYHVFVGGQFDEVQDLWLQEKEE